MSSRVVALVSVLSGAVLALWYVRGEVAAQTYKEQDIGSDYIEQTSSTGCPGADEMSQNAATAGVTEFDVDALEQLNQQNGGIVAEPVVRERMPGGEVIYRLCIESEKFWLLRLRRKQTQGFKSSFRSICSAS